MNYDAKEQAYLYDLYIVPAWREVFDRLVDKEVELPKDGKFLDAMCGTGGYALDLSLRAGAKVEVIGIDDSEERLALARGKADVKKPNRASFRLGSLKKLDFPTGEFDLVIGDLSLLAATTPVAELEDVLAELVRVAKKGATVVVKLATHGSFGEFFSVYWESLFDLDLVTHSPEIERMISERPTIGDAETLALEAGLRKARSVFHIERLEFKDAAEFFASPLVDLFLRKDWFAFWPDAQIRKQVQDQLAVIIDRERQNSSFDVSVKATLIIGHK